MRYWRTSFKKVAAEKATTEILKDNNLTTNSFSHQSKSTERNNTCDMKKFMLTHLNRR